MRITTGFNSCPVGLGLGSQLGAGTTDAFDQHSFAAGTLFTAFAARMTVFLIRFSPAQ